MIMTADEKVKMDELEKQNAELGQLNSDLQNKIDELEHELENQKKYAKGLQTKLKHLGEGEASNVGDSKTFNHS